MREILFRGKRIDEIGNPKEWVEGGFFLEPYTDKAFIIRWNSFGLGFNEFIEVASDTIGQYTGLKDKNGQMIFEGDIVEAVLPQTTAQMGFVLPIMPVVFRDAVFGLMDYRDDVTPFRSFAPRVTFEVKGNIHDNTELLKGEEE